MITITIKDRDFEYFDRDVIKGTLDVTMNKPQAYELLSQLERELLKLGDTNAGSN